MTLDSAQAPGGAWPRMWTGCGCSPPPSSSSLPGWMMPAWNDARLGYPPRDHVVDYLTALRAALRPGGVAAAPRPHGQLADDDPQGRLLVAAGDLTVAAGAVVARRPGPGTGRSGRLPGDGAGSPVRSCTPPTIGRRRSSPGSGSSSWVAGTPRPRSSPRSPSVAETTWVTSRPPRFLPDDVDGRALFATARARIRALERGARPRRRRRARRHRHGRSASGTPETGAC